MRKFYLLTGCVIIASATLFFVINQNLPREKVYPVGIISETSDSDEGENEKYDGPEKAAELEFEKTKDPSLGYVPYDRLMTAIDYTENIKQSYALASRRSVAGAIA